MVILIYIILFDILFFYRGNDFLRPLVKFEETKLFNVEYAHQISEYIKKGENVVMLSNHQTEVDPQVMSILLEQENLSELAEKIIFIAGHKVTNDPVAIPFSMGRNLICIHSKKHIKNPPENAQQKQSQNLQSMQEMTRLMSEGGKCFWVAPSGGRDRPDPITNEFVVSPYDLKALDMFKLVAMQSKKVRIIVLQILKLIYYILLILANSFLSSCNVYPYFNSPTSRCKLVISSTFSSCYD